MMNKKHGGKREGAGQPKRYAKNLSLRVSISLLECISKKYTSEERNELIREFLKTLM